MKTRLTLLLILFFQLNTFAQYEPLTINGSSIAFSSDGKMLASATLRGRYVEVWNISTGERILTLDENDTIYSFALSPDGTILVTGERNGKLSPWDVSTRKRTVYLNEHSDREDVVKLLFSPDGKTLVSVSQNDQWYPGEGVKIDLLDTDTWMSKSTISIDEQFGLALKLAQSLSFSRDSSTLAVANQLQGVDLWDVSTGEIKRTLVGHKGAVYSTSFSPDGKTLASGSSDGTVRLWNVDTGNLKNTIEGQTDTINRVLFSPDGKTLLINMQDDKAYLLDVDTNTYKTKIKGKSGSFSPDSSILATIDNTAVYLWDVETARPKHTFDVSSSNDTVLFSPDGNTLAMYGASIHLWNLQTANRVSIKPYKVVSPANGQHFTINVSIENGQNIGGYQFSVIYDSNVLRYVGSANEDYLPVGAFPIPPIVDENKITLAATSVAGTANGDGNLASLTFEVFDIKATNLMLSDIILTDSEGEILKHLVFNTGLVIDPQLRPEDVNSDGIVNIIDLVQVASRFNHTIDIDKEDINGDGVVNIVDLVKVAAALGSGENAPTFHSQDTLVSARDVLKWITQAQHLNLTDPISLQGMRVLKQLLFVLTPKETALLPNYPNPFNPETWIPYQLAKTADVSISIYAADGQLVRKLELGQQASGIYYSRSRAAYWDGKNVLGESVASGVYFYTITADDFTATRKMLIRK